MAKTITERTLRGYSNYKTNVIYYANIIEDTKQHRDHILNNIGKLFKGRGREELKFDVIIGNPPYQEMDGGAQASASPIYQNFVKAAKEMNPRYISLIMPSRWYVGGKGLDAFRDEMLNDEHLRELHDWLTPEDIFPNTNIRGGVCYFLWDSKYDNRDNLTRVVTYEHNQIVKDVMRPMKVSDLDIFIRDSEASAILSKVFGVHQYSNSIEWFVEYASPRKPYGFSSNFTNDSRFKKDATGLIEPIKCYGKGVIGYVERKDIDIRTEWIDKWKVFTSRANNIGTELNDDNFNTIIGTPGTIYTETYLVIGADLELNSDKVENLAIYLKTKFSRYLHSLAKSSQDATRSTYRFIPMQDFSNIGDINWSLSSHEIDLQLYRKYDLSEQQIAYIESKIKDM